MTDTAHTLPDKQKSLSKQQSQFQSFQIQSDILLSRIQYSQQPDSPQINYNAAQAKIKELTQTAEPINYKKSKPYCGCGQFYSCTSSLYLHIRSKHGGIPPAGTIGGPKGIVKKPMDLDGVVKLEEEVNHGLNKGIASNTNGVRGGIGELGKVGLGLANTQTHGDHSRREVKNKKNCKLCSKTYSCNSSLNLHLKRKHEIYTTSDGRTQFSPRIEDRQQRCFECTICNLNYGSKSALGLHYNNKHSSKGQNQKGLPYKHKCGCGLAYQSRSALNMHVKKKHEGIYPEGTTEKPNLRGNNNNIRDQKGNLFESYIGPNPIYSAEEQSIYDSQSQGNPKQKPQHPSTQRKLLPQQIQKPYKCGCGRTYSCSSSLNLHIKKNHLWIVPQGTIGGPRGIRSQQQIKSNYQKERNCDECKKQIAQNKDGVYYLCRSCEDHRICCECFWEKNNYKSQEHKWEQTYRNN